MVTERISIRLAERTARKRPKQRRLNLRGMGLMWFLVLAAITGVLWLARTIAPLVQLRVAETRHDLSAVSAEKGLIPFCFMASAMLAVVTGVYVYRSGPRRGFAVAGGLSTAVLLLLLWAVSTSREPLDAIRLNDVQVGDVVYVCTYFLPFFLPIVSFVAWYLSTLDFRR